MCKFLKKLLTGGGGEQPSPSDIFRGEKVSQLFREGTYYESGLYKRVKKELLNIPFEEDPELWISPIPDTNSMDPVFDKGHNNLYIRGFTGIDQQIMINWIALQYAKGSRDILVYKLGSDRPIVHRVSRMEDDIIGRRWWFKGDNNMVEDPKPATDAEIEWLYAGTIC